MCLVVWVSECDLITVPQQLCSGVSDWPPAEKVNGSPPTQCCRSIREEGRCGRVCRWRHSRSATSRS
jgi:hypothetical protein